MPTFSIPRPSKIYQIGIFGSKNYHLATLVAQQLRRARVQSERLNKNGVKKIGEIFVEK
jgi:hypothetical protein